MVFHQCFAYRKFRKDSFLQREPTRINTISTILSNLFSVKDQRQLLGNILTKSKLTFSYYNVVVLCSVQGKTHSISCSCLLNSCLSPDIICYLGISYIDCSFDIF